MSKANPEIKSHHTFLFPFTWDYKPKGEKLGDLSIKDRKKINKFESLLNKNKWKESNFKLTKDLNYNEYNYFYEEARKVIYNNDPDNSNMRYFEYDLKDGATYNIYLSSDQESNPDYQLNIQRIALRVYDTGVAILSYHLDNYENVGKEDILKINQYGRRVYVPFKPLDECKGDEIAKKIVISFQNHKNIEENYETDSSEDAIVRSSKLVTGLLGDQFKLIERFKSHEDKEEITLSPIIDDRMFVLCWYGNDFLAEKLSRFNQSKKAFLDSNCFIQNFNGDGKYQYLEDDFWYQYLFIDGGFKTCQSKVMTKELLENHTNDRWIEIGTLYGISKYSFVMLTDEGDFAKGKLLNDLKHHYYQLASLALMQQASVLSFSKEAAYTSKNLKDTHNSNAIEEIRILHRKYIKFINSMYFREVTAQEQGIELYDMLTESMRIEKEANNLDNEIDELHSYATLMEETYRNKLLALITVVGALFAVPNFVSSFFGMNIFPEVLADYSITEFLNKDFYMSTGIWNWLALYFSVPGFVGIIIWKIILEKEWKGKLLFGVLLFPIIMALVLNLI